MKVYRVKNGNNEYLSGYNRFNKKGKLWKTRISALNELSKYDVPPDWILLEYDLEKITLSEYQAIQVLEKEELYDHVRTMYGNSTFNLIKKLDNNSQSDFNFVVIAYTESSIKNVLETIKYLNFKLNKEYQKCKNGNCVAISLKTRNDCMKLKLAVSCKLLIYDMAEVKDITNDNE